MNSKTLLLTLTTLLITGTGVVMACEYKAGESKFVDYATCRYGEDSIEVIKMPANSAWENCVYLVQAFRPEKLLAVTREKDGKEILSINDRSQIGNPCYMTKKSCDAALEAFKQSQ